MTVSPSVLLISIAIGVPLMLLALGVLYHAYLLGKQPLDLDAHVEDLAIDPNEAMRGLQRSMNDIRGELTRQRTSLRGMLSDVPAAADSAAPMPRPSVAPTPLPLPDTMPAATPILPIDRTARELRAAVHDLAAEGLSDRSIARRLRIGLEEVRLARASGIAARRMA